MLKQDIDGKDFEESEHMRVDQSIHTTEALYEDLHRADLQDVIAARLRYLENGNNCREIPAHYHDFIEIIFGIRGSFSVNLTNRSFEIHENEMLLINVNEVHSFHHAEPCEYYCLQFNPLMVFSSPAYSTSAKYLLPFLSATTLQPDTDDSYSLFATKEDLEGSHIAKLIEDAHREYMAKEPGYELAMRSDVYRIFLWYLRRMEQNGISLFQTSNIRQEDIVRLKSVLDYIQENYMHPVQVEKMAKLCNMSYSYFSRFFRHCMGQTFSDYLLYVRLMEAEKLLMTTSRSISQIALDTGFSTSSYFITQFKKHRNITPKQLKQQIHSDSEK